MENQDYAVDPQTGDTYHLDLSNEEIICVEPAVYRLNNVEDSSK